MSRVMSLTMASDSAALALMSRIWVKSSMMAVWASSSDLKTCIKTKEKDKEAYKNQYFQQAAKKRHQVKEHW